MGMRIAVQTVPPWFVGGARHFTAGVLLFAFAALVLRQRPSWEQIKTGFMCGLLLVALGNGPVVWAEQTIPSSTAAFLVSAMPIWLAVIDFVWFGIRPAPAGIVGLVLGLVGVFVLVYDVHQRSAALFPALVCLAASIAWAFGTLYQRQSRGSDQVFTVTGLQMLFGGAILLVTSALSGVKPAPVAFVEAVALAGAGDAPDRT